MECSYVVFDRRALICSVWLAVVRFWAFGLAFFGWLWVSICGFDGFLASRFSGLLSPTSSSISVRRTTRKQRTREVRDVQCKGFSRFSLEKHPFAPCFCSQDPGTGREKDGYQRQFQAELRSLFYLPDHWSHTNWSPLQVSLIK